MTDATLWPDRPMNPMPDIRDGDSIVIVRLDPETARWLYERDRSDPTLTREASEVLRVACQSDKHGQGRR